MSTIAVFLALGGGAWAASSGLVGPSGALRACVDRGGSLKVVRSGAKCHRGATTISLGGRGATGAQGPAGPAGTAGATGPQGAAGTPGTPGTDATASVTMSARASFNIGENGYFAASGLSAPSATETSAVSLTGSQAIVARHLTVRDVRTTVNDNTRVYVLRVNGADTALTCSLISEAGTCTDDSHAVTIPPRSEVSIHREVITGTGGGADGTWVLASWIASPS